MVNADYDKLVDKLRATAPDSPEAIQIFRDAMKIWYAEQPDAPVAQFYLRTPMNTKYWTNWPSTENPYMQAANQFRSFNLLLYNVKRATN